MTGSSHDPLVTGKVALPSERSTGLVFAAVALVVAVLFRNTLAVLVIALAMAAGFAAASLAAPHLLRPLNRAWFGLSLLLHKIVNPIVMLAIFGLMFVPMGLAMRPWRDPLLRRRRPDLSSYWVKRGPEDSVQSMRNQF